MLRFVVIAVVLACALGQNVESGSGAQPAVTGNQFEQGVSKHDRLQKNANKECTNPEENKLQYFLYTRENPYGEQIQRDPRNISDSSMNVKKNLKVIVHSWLQNRNWITPVVRDYLYTQNVDVMVLDWSEYSENCNVESTTKYIAPFVGESLAHMLSEMIGLGQSERRMHLVGFSHGAHIVGIAGRMMAPHLPARISALDPLRLKESDQVVGGKMTGGDARFMDVIVTSKPGLTYDYEMGDVTFYPNGGYTAYQPSCEDIGEPLPQMICSHALAYRLFAESIVSPQKFPAVKCNDYSKFLAGKCNSAEKAHMGEYVESHARGEYMLAINKNYPYDKGYDFPASAQE